MKKGLINIFKIMVLVIVVMFIFKTTTKDDVFALANTNALTISFRDNYNVEQGRVEYSLDDGANWISVTSSINNQAIVMAGDNLRIKIVPNDGYEIDWAGIAYGEDATMYNLNEGSSGTIVARLQSDGYEATGTANHIRLENVEFRQKNNNEPGGEEPFEHHFDGKAYVVWSCGDGTCYHYFEDIPNFDDGKSTFYKDTNVKADTDDSIKFDVQAKNKGWILKEDFERWVNAYKEKNNIEEINWTNVDPEDIIGSPPDMREWEEKAIKAGACTREDNPQDVFERCVDEYAAEHGGNELPFVKLQPVGEPDEKNAYVSYGDRNFKVVIYSGDYKGVTIGDLSDLNYYPAEWSNPFIRQDQFDISDTTKEKPTYVNSILLENTLNIKTLNYNGFEITKLEALDVPSNAVKVSKVNGEWKLVFSSHFYDKVVFKATDNNGKISYFAVKRYTVDAWINNVEGAPHLYAEVYYDRNNTYSDFDLTAKITYKDGTVANVELTHYNKIDDGLGNIATADEVDQEESEYGETGKGLKKAVFIYKLPNGKTDRDIKNAYINIEYKGSTKTNYAGAYAGSGKGVLANIYQEEEEE